VGSIPFPQEDINRLNRGKKPLNTGIVDVLGLVTLSFGRASEELGIMWNPWFGIQSWWFQGLQVP